MSAATRSSYYDTLLDVRHEIMARLSEARAVLEDPEFFLFSFKSFSGGVPYGTQARHSAPLRFLKDRATLKHAHAIVDRCASGRYELTFYIL